MRLHDAHTTRDPRAKTGRSKPSAHLPSRLISHAHNIQEIISPRTPLGRTLTLGMETLLSRHSVLASGLTVVGRLSSQSLHRVPPCM